jgi:isopentenyl-diphosphate delta-isomerase
MRARGALVEEVILVDEEGREIGSAEKLEAHRNGGRRHLAFSIVLFNRNGETLLQRRSKRKYHFGGLWTNSCCGHPRPGEVLAEAARRRLREELGVSTELRAVFCFAYRATDPGSGLSENEVDHVFVGQLDDEPDDEPRPDPEEIDDLRWIEHAELERDIAAHPERYTPWFAQLAARLPELRAASLRS